MLMVVPMSDGEREKILAYSLELLASDSTAKVRIHLC